MLRTRQQQGDTVCIGISYQGKKKSVMQNRAFRYVTFRDGLLHFTLVDNNQR